MSKKRSKKRPAYPGVERDTSRTPVRWRARPIWRGCRVNLGSFKTRKEAAAAVAEYLADRADRSDRELYRRREYWLTGFYTKRLRTCAAVVETMRGWHDIEWPAGYPRPLARQAAKGLQEIYWSPDAADRDFYRLLTITRNVASRPADQPTSRPSDRPPETQQATTHHM